MKDTLASIQGRFQNYVLDKSGPILEDIVSTPSISARQRMEVYENAYRLRLIETLADNFIGLKGLAGDEQFERIARCYIDAVPSTFRNIRWYGDQLSGFLAITAPWSQNPVFSEMALADWSILLAFDAPDADSITEQTILELPQQAWTRLGLEFHPCLQRVDVTHNVFKFRKQFINDSDDIQPPRAAGQPVPWLIWRKDLKQMYRSMDVDEAWAIDQARLGLSFPELCEGVCEWIDPEHAAARAAGFLKQWVSDGLIVGVRN